MFPRGNFNTGGGIRTHMEQNVPLDFESSAFLLNK
jgi:hypothetical protein